MASDSCSGDGHGRFNQFVPQLMLGSALCNSSNAARDPTSNKTYAPHWCKFDRWHIGAQYFFALYPDPANHSSASGFDARAATGELIAVARPAANRPAQYPNRKPQSAGRYRKVLTARAQKVNLGYKDVARRLGSLGLKRLSAF